MESNRDTKYASIPDVGQRVTHFHWSGTTWKCVIKAASFSIMAH